jgi:hypothetical protein
LALTDSFFLLNRSTFVAIVELDQRKRSMDSQIINFLQDFINQNQQQIQLQMGIQFTGQVDYGVLNSIYAQLIQNGNI